MPVQRKQLSVLPNPWTHIDEKGRPAGAVIVEQPGNGTFDRRWVGASFKAIEVQATQRVTVKGRSFEKAPAIHEHEWDHVTEPVLVPNTPYYRKCVFKGDLLAADEATAFACGISKQDFLKQDELLARIKKDAIAEFDSRNGEGAFDALADIREEDAEQAEKVAAAVAAAANAPTDALDTEAGLDEHGAQVQGVEVLEGVTLPADGIGRTVALGAIAGGEPLPTIETDANGEAIALEGIAPAFTTTESSSRSKSRKGSDQ